MYRTVLVGTHGSLAAGRAVRRAVAVCERFDARLLVAYVGEAAAGMEVLDGVARQYADTGVEMTTSVLTGDPVDALLGLATAERVDLLVIGNRGVPVHQRLLPSALPDKLLHRAGCDVLVVRSSTGAQTDR